MIPVAYLKPGTELKPAVRNPLQTAVHWETW